jgi:hypothetical protein
MTSNSSSDNDRKVLSERIGERERLNKDDEVECDIFFFIFWFFVGVEKDEEEEEADGLGDAL